MGRSSTVERTVATPEPVRHERRFRFDPLIADLDITDMLSGTGEHRLRWHFHFAPGVTAELAGTSSCVLASGGVRVTMWWSAAAAATLSDGWYSPSYGVQLVTRMLDLRLTATLDGKNEWSFSFRREGPR
jgi:hypothetical protein